MSTRGQFNTKNPTIKRILKEASELANHPSADFHATPLEDNLFEWPFTLRGPPAPSPYEGGIYHGRIVLPSAYPHRPPSFRFLTPSGRFEVNREICLSISGFHEETWQPAWGIRTALVAIRSFMDTGAKGQIGGLECDEDTRRRFAAASCAWKCASCATSNEDIIKAREEAVKGMEGTGAKEEEKVPDEPRLAYREDLGGSTPSAGPAKGKEKAEEEEKPKPVQKPAAVESERASPRPRLAAGVPPPTRTVPLAPAVQQQAQLQRQPNTENEGNASWVDHAIFAVIGALVFLLIRKIL